MSVDPNSEAVEPTTPLISLPPTTKKFTAGGHTYFVEDSLSLERYKAFQRMELELGYGLSFSSLHEKISTAYGLLNENKLADAAVLLYSVMEGAVNLSEKKPIGLWVSTLFVNRSDEDRTTWSKTIAEEKLEHWKDIEANFFLIVALSKVSNFTNSLREISKVLETVGGLKDQMIDDTFPLESE